MCVAGTHQAEDPANNPGCLRDDGSNIEAGNETGGQDLSGEVLVFSPEWSANLNARIALASIEDTWTIALIGKNLTDEETHIWKNDAPVTDSNSYFAVPERPRSYAIQVRYRF